MKNQVILPILFLFVFYNNTYSQKTIVSGNAPSYSKEVLNICTYDEPITHTPKIIAATTVDDSGDFSFEFVVEDVLMAFIDLGVNRGLIYVKPDMTYVIKLPEKQPKTTADILNPFFEPIEFYIGITNHDKTELNYRLRHFDDLYNRYTSQNFNKILKLGRAANVDTVIAIIDSLCPGSEPYFVEYKRYQFAYLRHLAYERDKYFAIDKYFLKQSILYNNSAYTLLFNQLFDGFLQATGKIDEIAYQIIVTKRLSPLKQILNEYVADPELQELILLKGLYDGYFAKEYPSEGVLALLDSIAEQSSNKVHLKLIENAKVNITRLLEGYEPPDIVLPMEKGMKMSLKQFEGKFVYLNFCTIKSYTCLQHLPLLQSINETFANDLKIISIIVDENYDEVVKQFRAQNYNWTLVHFDGTNELTTQYRVVVYPTYYLISPEGLLMKNPAIGPDENFITFFANILNQRKIEEERKQYEENNKNND